MSDYIFDAFAFARQKEHRSKKTPLSEFPRLFAESRKKDGMVTWSLSGDVNELGYLYLKLSVSVSLTFECQRCLTDFSLDVKSSSTLVLAKDEKDADKIDALLNDDDIETIVGSSEMDLRDLIEDEALLALPISPKHDVCPEKDRLPMQAGTKISPFSVLEKLKKR